MKTWKYKQAVECNAPNYFAITTGEWGAPTIAKAYDKKDARLISAAPDLLEALKELVRIVPASNPLYTEALSDAINAIEKAEV